MIYPSKHISITINKSADLVYLFASNPENLPKWASGLSQSVRKSGDTWITQSPFGEVMVRFTEKNSFGILDHVVTLPSGENVYNPLRIFPNGEGSEVLFSLYWLPGRSEEDFNEDAKMVESDLIKLKEIVERD